MIVEIYDALMDAGAAEPKAAEAMAGQEDRFHRLEAKLDGVERRLDAKIDAVAARLDAKIDLLGATLRADIAAVRPEQMLIRWMFGTLLAINVTILVKLFVH